MQVLLFLEQAQQQLVEAAVDGPVEVAQIVAGGVVAVVGELDAGAGLARAALGAHAPENTFLRDDVEVLELLQELLVELASGLLRCLRQDRGDDRVGIDALGLALEVEDQAVAQAPAAPPRGCRRVETAKRPSSSAWILAPSRQRLRAARRGAVAHVLLRQRRPPRASSADACASSTRTAKSCTGRATGTCAHQLAQLEQRAPPTAPSRRAPRRRRWCGRGWCAAPRATGNSTLQLEEEAIELRLGQRIGAFHLERVLRREHEERLRRACRWSCATVTDCSCIASSSADCVLGVARLISSASTMLAKIGPRWNSKRLPPLVLDDDVGADDVGRHQVGRELDAREGQVAARRRACAPASSCRGRARLRAARGRRRAAP